MKIQAHVFTNREISLLQKAVYQYIVSSEDENGNPPTDTFFRKEYEDMKALYLTL